MQRTHFVIRIIEPDNRTGTSGAGDREGDSVSQGVFRFCKTKRAMGRDSGDGCTM